MEWMDVVLLSRLQFALTIMFHYIFPPLTIGMGVVLVFLEAGYLRTGDETYHKAAKFWTGIFALNFAIGVASGIVMEFEFGTNWATYSRFVGDVFGSALAAEGIFAFFLESGFLAVLVFGWDKVGKKMHFFSTCMVSLGSIFSSVWIVVANSWQQTPAGSEIVPIMRDGEPWVVGGVAMMRAEINDFWALVFNPSTVHRLTHVWIGCFIMGSFFIMSISAWYLLRGKHEEFARRSFRGALLLATVASIASLISGHFNARMVYEHQPAKMAAFEGHFETGRGDLTIIGWPNAEEGKTSGLSIPGGLSFLVHDDFNEPVLGLNDFRPEHQPPLGLSFSMFHLMVGTGFGFIGLTLLACLLLRGGRLWRQRWLLWIFVLAVLPAVGANQAGWIAAEVGRQPWIVHPKILTDEAGQPVKDAEGYIQYETVQKPTGEVMIAGLRTDEAVSKAIKAEQVLGSIIGFALVYLLLGAVWIFVLNHKIQKGPEPIGGPEGEGGFFETAGAFAEHKGSLTEAHGEKGGTPDESGV